MSMDRDEKLADLRKKIEELPEGDERIAVYRQMYDKLLLDGVGGVSGDPMEGLVCDSCQ